MLDEFELTDQPSTRHDSSPDSLHRPTVSFAMSLPSQAEASNSPSIDTDNPSLEEKLNHRTVLKLDLVLLPFVSLLFLFNSLDRSNVGNAETANFTKDAGLQPQDLNTAVACFFAFFVILQPVGAAVGRRYGMARIVPVCMALWGVCTAAHVLIRKKWELITVRILIGILEAGFYPTTVSYLSLFYTRYEFARRLGFFYGQIPVAGALGGVISYAVFSAYPSEDNQVQHPSREHGVNGSRHAKWRPWQVLFLLEGVLTISVALIGFLWLPRSAQSAWFLRASERQWAERRVLRDRQVVGPIDSSPAKSESSLQDHDDENNEMSPDQASNSDTDEEQYQHLLNSASNPQATSDQPHQASTPTNTVVTSDKGLTLVDIREAFSDWKIWYLLIINICSSIPAMAFSVFLPLVVKGLGIDPIRANLLTAPPFITGALTLWLFAWWSDKKRERILPILYGLAINLLGLTATVTLPEAAYRARYAGLCVLLAGSFVASPLTVAWLAGNIEEPGKRAIVLGINGWGTLAGLFSALLFAPRYAPHYRLPFYVTFVSVLFAFLGYAAFRVLLRRENRLRAQMLASWSGEEVRREKTWGAGPFRRRRGLLDLLGLSGVADRIDMWSRGGRITDSDRASEVTAAGWRRRGDDRLTFVYGL